jgi:hypothetical protein
VTTIALLSGCAANTASTPAAAKNTQAECERGGGLVAGEPILRGSRHGKQ